MAAKYILGVLSVVFLVAGAMAVAGGQASRRSQGRTWLTIGAIFAVVSLWLFG
jgi:hypothetical protein